jgi:hypothetical protein
VRQAGVETLDLTPALLAHEYGHLKTSTRGQQQDLSKQFFYYKHGQLLPVALKQMRHGLAIILNSITSSWSMATWKQAHKVSSWVPQNS